MEFSKLLLQEEIEKEKVERDSCYSRQDLLLLNEMFEKINATHSTNYHYLAELDSLVIPSSAPIILQYIQQFQSETIRAYLIPQIVSGHLTEKDLDFIILDLYKHFKQSSCYISPPSVPAPAHIYVRYDNAFIKIKSKRIKTDLTQLVSSPRDAFYLPLTTKMLASWKLPEMKTILVSYLDSDRFTFADLGLSEENAHLCFPPLSSIKRELKFLALMGLKYFASSEIFHFVQKVLNSSEDKDIRLAAQKCLKVIEAKTNG